MLSLCQKELKGKKKKVKHGSMNSFFQLFYKTIQIPGNESSNDISLLKNLMKEIIL